MSNKFITTTSLDEVILPDLKQKIKDYLNPCVDITSIQTPDAESFPPTDWGIDTGLKLNYGYKYEVKAKNDKDYSSASLIDGGTNDSSISTANRPRMGFVIYNKANPRIQAWIKGRGAQEFFGVETGINWEEDYVITLDNTGVTITQNGNTQSGTWANTPATGTDNYPIYLLFNSTLSTNGVSYGPATVYYIKIYDTDHTTLLRDFVPSYNRRTATYGFYDKVEGKFYYPPNTPLAGTK